MTKNQYGLDRKIPGEVARQVRQRCGFGCVICGLAVYQYEHFDPDFKDATTHNPDGITLLCGSCHDNVTRRVWSKEKVRLANQNPRCLGQGFSWGAFDISTKDFEFVLGGVKMQGVPVPLLVSNQPLIEVAPPEQEGAPFRLSAHFYDQTGKLTFSIVSNEWKGPIENWDIEHIGGRFTIRKKMGDIVLQFKCYPPKMIVVERLKMTYDDSVLSIGPDSFLTVLSKKSGTNMFVGPGHCLKNFEVGILVPGDGNISLGRGGLGNAFFGPWDHDSILRE